MLWIIKNQLGRRNLSAYDRSILALRLKPVIAAKAKENLTTHTSSGYQPLQKSVKAVNTQQELAKTAGVSHDTIAKVEKIEQQASPEIKAALRTGDLSINAAYNEIKRAEKATQIADAKADIAAQVADEGTFARHPLDIHADDTSRQPRRYAAKSDIRYRDRQGEVK